MKYCLPALLLLLCLSACGTDPYTPKNRGYYHIDLPQHQYTAFNDPTFPYSFEVPTYAHIVRDTNYFNAKPENPYWINVNFPELNATIFLSYKQIGPTQPLRQLLEDAHAMSYFHDKKADYINDTSFTTAHGIMGVMYSVGGNAASSYQFFATDTTTHFLRGSLYFDVTPNADSLAPVNTFLKKDIEHLIGTLQWR